MSARYILKLFITGNTMRTRRAIRAVRDICRHELAGEYDLRIIDVLERPDLAERERIVATPTLVRELPPPLSRVIGDLSEREQVILGLDLYPADGEGTGEEEE